jgi:hypothetical protein
MEQQFGDDLSSVAVARFKIGKYLYVIYYQNVSENAHWLSVSPTKRATASQSALDIGELKSKFKFQKSLTVIISRQLQNKYSVACCASKKIHSETTTQNTTWLYAWAGEYSPAYWLGRH